MEKKKITVEEWIDIAASMISSFCDKLEDDGKISLSDGLSLLVQLLKLIAQAYKN